MGLFDFFNPGSSSSPLSVLTGAGAPKTPDPNASAAAQSALNNVSQYTPWGSSVYSPNGTGPGGVQTYRQDVTLSPDQQRLFDQQQQQAFTLGGANGNLANQISANSQSGPINGGSSIWYGHNLAANSGPIQSDVPNSQGLQYGVGGTGQQAINQAMNASYNQATSYLDPQMRDQQNQLNAQLANQGVTAGSKAYQNAQDQQGRNSAFAYNQAQDSAVQAGQNEQNTLYNQNLSSANQYNSAVGQNYNQNLASGQFANQAQNQQYGQNLSTAQFNNAAEQQAFQQNAYNANQPINQYSALNGLTQVSSPQFSQTPTAPNIMGAYQNNYNQQVGQANNQTSGLFSLGGSAIMGSMLSDRRTKKEIKRIGQTPGGVPVYEYKYKSGGAKQTGVMAQDVELVIPDAVVIDAMTGFKKVNYARVK